MASCVDIAGTSLYRGLNILFEIMISSFVGEGSSPKLGRGIFANLREKRVTPLVNAILYMVQASSHGLEDVTTTRRDLQYLCNPHQNPSDVFLQKFLKNPSQILLESQGALNSQNDLNKEQSWSSHTS